MSRYGIVTKGDDNGDRIISGAKSGTRKKSASSIVKKRKQSVLVPPPYWEYVISDSLSRHNLMTRNELSWLQVVAMLFGSILMVTRHRRVTCSSVFIRRRCRFACRFSGRKVFALGSANRRSSFIFAVVHRRLQNIATSSPACQ